MLRLTFVPRCYDDEGSPTVALFSRALGRLSLIKGLAVFRFSEPRLWSQSETELAAITWE